MPMATSLLAADKLFEAERRGKEYELDDFKFVGYFLKTNYNVLISRNPNLLAIGNKC